MVEDRYDETRAGRECLTWLLRRARDAFAVCANVDTTQLLSRNQCADSALKTGKPAVQRPA
jgi:hypothetical protein